jgi:hypothetical protein
VNEHGELLASLAVAAETQVQQAQDGEANAGWNVLSEAMIGLREWLDGRKPDPHRLVFLRGLLASLESVERGMDPGTALHLKQGHRRPSTSVALRDLLLWVEVGQELDHLTIEREHTRSDKPTDAALKSVAKKRRLSLATVKKAWHVHGAAEKWEAEDKADWK